MLPLPASVFRARESLGVYKACDIRGDASTELTPELYRRWGVVLGGRVAPRSKFVVAGDVRRSTPPFLAALVEGLCQYGLDVINLEVLPTPMAYYAQRRLGAAGVAVVTASHNPPQANGLQWMIGEQPPTEADVAALQRDAAAPESVPEGVPPSRPRSLDISFDYVAWLQETWMDAMGAQCRVILDPMHGCGARRARRYLQAVFPQSLFTAIHDTPDPALADRAPDCSQAENLQELSDAVYRQRADLGLAFDGDGDRLALVDNDGNVLTADEATCVLLHSFDGQLQGQPFVYDVTFSDRVPESARKLGARPLVERTGHAFVRSRMVQSGAPFGAEASGHYFFGALGGGDDALFAACRVIAHLAACGKSLADLRRACPPVFMTPDLRVPVDLDRHAAILQQVRQRWPNHPQSLTDGVRIDFPDGWALVRGSVTEPVVTFRFESVDWPSLYLLVWHFADALGDVGHEVWERFTLAMGHVSADAR